MRRRRKGRFISLAETQKSNRELSVRRYAFKNSISQLEKLLPAWKRVIEPCDAARDDRIAKEDEADAECHAFEEHVRGGEDRGGEHGDDERSETDPVEVWWEWWCW